MRGWRRTRAALSVGAAAMALALLVWLVPRLTSSSGEDMIAREVAQGRLHSQVSEVGAFNNLAAAIERNRTQPHQGKAVVDFSL